MTVSVPPTSHDVARLAGVSQAAVSYALTGKGTISETTRERILQVADSIGYRPNLAARSMRTRRSGRLAVVTGVAIDHQMRMLSGAAEVARAEGYVMETHTVHGSAEDRTARVAELATSWQFEGVLTLLPVSSTAIPQGPDAATVITAMAFDERERSVGELTDASIVEHIVSSLAADGHRRFLHIAGSQQFASARARKEVYLSVVERLGLESLGVVGEEWGGEVGCDAVLALPADAPPLAVIAANDLLALGALRGAVQRGWTVPGDLVLTGWDDNPFTAFTSPSLTSVAVDFPEAGRAAMRHLVAAVRGEAAPPPAGTLQQVMWRESTGDTHRPSTAPRATRAGAEVDARPMGA